MKGSPNKKSKLPLDVFNSGKQSKIDKSHNTEVTVSEDINGVRINFNGSWLGISPAVSRLLSAALLISADKADKLKVEKVK